MPLARPPLTLLLAMLLIALLAVLPAGAAQEDAASAGPLHRAGLVVRHGDGAMTYAVVAFAEDSISGIDLLDRSGIAYLSVPFGGLGEGVCQIEREGCEVSECRRTVCQATRSSPYWQYLDQGADESWRAAPLGASGSRVEDGDVLAWTWSPELPALPPLDLAGVAAAAGIDAVALDTLGLGDTPVAVMRSGVGIPDDAADVRALVGGGGALVLVVVTGVGLLLVRRRRMVAT